MMNKEKKKNYINQMTTQFDKSEAVIVAHYQGLTVKQLDDLKKAILDSKLGQAEIKNDKDGNIGLSLGKKSFSDDKVIKNYIAILDVLEREKGNQTIKGDLIKSAFITSTMGVSYKLKLPKNI